MSGEPLTPATTSNVEDRLDGSLILALSEVNEELALSLETEGAVVLKTVLDESRGTNELGLIVYP